MSSSHEAFDRALFGRTVARIGLHGQVLKTWFDADGLFNKGTGAPTWAGVLAFVNVGLRGGADPVLYLHPRFKGRLPDALLTHERRTYDAGAEGITVDESSTEILEKVRFVPYDV
jgi:hypothetical protein